MKGKQLEMAAKIVTSVNEMMKYSITAYCTLHFFTWPYDVHRGKCYYSYSHTAVGTMSASESGLDECHQV